MPLPAILGAAAAIAGATGVGSAIHGGVKMKKANKGFFTTDVDIALEGVLWKDEEEKEDEPAGAE